MAIQLDWTPVKLMQYNLRSEQFNSRKLIPRFLEASLVPPLLKSAQQSFTYVTFRSSLEILN